MSPAFWTFSRGQYNCTSLWRDLNPLIIRSVRLIQVSTLSCRMITYYIHHYSRPFAFWNILLPTDRTYIFLSVYAPYSNWNKNSLGLPRFFAEVFWKIISEFVGCLLYAGSTKENRKDEILPSFPACICPRLSIISQFVFTTLRM